MVYRRSGMKKNLAVEMGLHAGVSLGGYVTLDRRAIVRPAKIYPGVLGLVQRRAGSLTYTNTKQAI